MSKPARKSGVPPTKRTQKGFSTDASSLEGLKELLDQGKGDDVDPKAYGVLDRILEFFRELLSENRPVVVRDGDVLHGVLAPTRVVRSEVAGRACYGEPRPGRRLDRGQ